MEIPVAGIPRLPGAGSSARGQSAPKARPKGVADGRQVNIPALAWRVQARRRRRTAAGVNGYPQYGRERPDRGRACPSKAARPRFQEKRRDTEVLAVPKPTQVGGCKDTQARGRNLVKELGNMTP